LYLKVLQFITNKQTKELVWLLQGKVKQIVGSTLRDLPPHDDEDSGTAVAAPLITNFESERSAGEFAEMYKNDGLHGGHVIMLGADPASHSAALEALAAFPGK
jgi:phosphoribosylformimino-5-aminoimidazole carboxamide ribotide isomerase